MDRKLKRTMEMQKEENRLLRETRPPQEAILDKATREGLKAARDAHRELEIAKMVDRLPGPDPAEKTIRLLVEAVQQLAEQLTELRDRVGKLEQQAPPPSPESPQSPSPSA